WSLSNYAGSLGPQCLTVNGLSCYPGAQTYQIYCDGNKGFTPPAGYGPSPDHGNAWGSGDIRGMFNRLGAKMNMGSMAGGGSPDPHHGRRGPARAARPLRLER